MTSKKKILVAILVCLVIVAMSISTLVACEDAKVKVTFKNGDQEVKVVEVAKGGTLAETDIPAAPEAPSGKVFDGWYNGETKLDIATKYDTDVTYEAKFKDATPTAEYVTVTFKNGDTTVKTALVVKGLTIAAADLPQDPEVDANHYFEGWFNGQTKFVSSATFDADTVFIASIKELGAEKGTYTGAEGDLVLDGKGAGTFNGETITYTVDGAIVTIGNKKVKLVEATYVLSDGMEGKYSYTSNYYGDEQVITYVLDGFGGGSYSATHSDPNYADANVECAITYVISEGTISFTHVDHSDLDGDLEIKAEGNVLFFGSAWGDTAYIKEGYTVEIDYASFNGWWQIEDPSLVDSYTPTYIYLELSADELIMKMDKETVDSSFLSFNWDGTVFTDGSNNYIVTEESKLKLYYEDWMGTFEALYTKMESAPVFPPEMFTVKFYQEKLDDFFSMVVVKEVEVEEGQPIAPEQFPTAAEMTKEGFTFAGTWVDYDGNEIDTAAAITENTAYYGTWTRDKYVVTFISEGQDTQTALYDISGTQAYEHLINDSEAPEGKTFMGWYNGDVKSEDFVGQPVDKDITFTALFNEEATYEGYWIDFENRKMVSFNTEAKTVYSGTVMNAANASYTYADGVMTYEGYTLTAIKDALTVKVAGQEDIVLHRVSHYGFDSDTPIGAPASGKYTDGGTGEYEQYIVISNDGLVTDFSGMEVKFGAVYLDTDAGAYKVVLLIADQPEMVLDLTGNDDFSKVTVSIQVEEETQSMTYFNANYFPTIEHYTAGQAELRVFTKYDDSKEYLYIDENGAPYSATVTGTFADGEKINVSYNNGTADVTIEYTVISAENKTLGIYIGMEGTYSSKDAYGSITYVLDGYGNGTYSDGYDECYVTYTISDNQLTIVHELDYLNGDPFTIVHDGNVLLLSSYFGDTAYLKEGYTITVDYEAFNGYWKQADSGEIIHIAYSADSIVITINGEAIDDRYVSASWDGAVIYNRNDEYSVSEGSLILNAGKPGAMTYTKIEESEVVWTVKFWYDGAAYATITVANGQNVANEDIPGDPGEAPQGYVFGSWYTFNADEEIVYIDQAVITGPTTFYIDTVQTQYKVTFKVSDTESSDVYIDIAAEGTDTVLTADVIPEAPKGEGVEGVFLGWVNNGKKAEAGYVLTYDITFTAKFVKESDYVGSWADTTAGEMLTFAEDKTVNGIGLSNKVFTFNSDGTMICEEGANLSRKTYTLAIGIDDKMTVTKGYVDGEEWVDVPVEATFARQAETKWNGTYKKDATGSGSFVVVDGGIITNFGGVSYYYAKFSASSSSGFIYYKNTATSEKIKLTIKIDANGAYVVTGTDAPASLTGIFFKNPDSIKHWWLSGNGNIIEIVVGSNVYYTKELNGVSNYITVTGKEGATVADGEILTVTDGANTYKIKVSGSSYVLAGAEAGTYGDLTLDGFGNATKGGIEYTYAVNANNVIVLTPAEGETIGLTLAEGAYTVVTPDAYKGLVYNQEGSSQTLIFDGYGEAVDKYYAYKYTLSDTTIVLDKEGYSNIKGTYEICENGDVLAGPVTFVKEGATLVSHEEDFVGNYANDDKTVTVAITVNAGTVMVNYNGTAYNATKNYNGTVITIKMVDYDSTLSDKPEVDFSFTISEDKAVLTMKHGCAALDQYGEGVEYTDKEITLNRVAEVALDGLEGTYTYNSITIVLNGDGTGTYDGQAITYTKGTGEGVYNIAPFGAFDADNNTFTVTATGISVSLDDAYGENPFSGEFAKQVEQLDAFAGTWTYGDYVYNFDGKGHVVVTGGYYAGEADYTIDGNVATFYIPSLYEDQTCTLADDGNTMTVNCSCGDCFNNCTFTKQA